MRSRRGPRLWSDDGGAVAVEFALVLPLLLLLVLGGIDWGYYFLASEAVGNAAREGARAGALTRSGNPCDPAVTTSGYSTAVQYLQRGRLITSGSDTRFVVLCTTVCIAGSCPAGPFGNVDAVKVIVRYAAKPPPPAGDPAAAATGSMSLTGFLPAQLLPRYTETTATMRLEP